MTRARGALAILVLSAIRTVRAEPCAPRAVLGGDAGAVAQVKAELERLGVATEAAADVARDVPHGGCRAVVAAVELDRGGGIAVAIRDGSARSEGRVVSDAVLAAAWIDSWLQDDLDPPAPRAAPPAEAVDALAARPGVAAAPVTTIYDRVAIAGGYEQTWNTAGPSWTGFGVAACARLDAFCVGARVSYASETVTAPLTSAARTDLAALATASWSHPLGAMIVAPELGVGVGRMATRRIDGCAPAKCDPTTDPNCLPDGTSGGSGACTLDANGTGAGSGNIYIGDHLDASTFTPRLEAALQLGVPLFAHVWLVGIASVTLAPFGHGPYAAMPAPDSSASPSDQTTLPGEPTAAFQLGIGLRVGAR